MGTRTDPARGNRAPENRKKKKMATNDKAAQTAAPTKSAVTDEDQEWMDGASNAFPKAEHLAPSLPPNYGPGRLVAIWAKSAGTRKNDQGKEYPFIQTITLVLDEGPNGQAWLTGTEGWDSEASTLIPAAPVRLDDFQHSTGGLVARLQKRLTAKNAQGIPLRWRPMVGRMNTQPSKANKNVAAFSISEPTAADMEVARKYKDMIIGINKEVEAAEKSAEDTAAFDE
jgi:hypothetical protein